MKIIEEVARLILFCTMLGAGAGLVLYECVVSDLALGVVGFGAECVLIWVGIYKVLPP